MLSNPFKILTKIGNLVTDNSMGGIWDGDKNQVNNKLCPNFAHHAMQCVACTTKNSKFHIYLLIYADYGYGNLYGVQIKAHCTEIYFR